MAEAKKGKPIIARLTKTTSMPAGKLSFNALLKPDTTFGDPTFYANVEYDEAGLDALAVKLKADIELLVPKFAEECEKQGKPKPPEVMSVTTWLEDHAKQPNDEKYLPYVKFSVKADGKTRDGEVFHRSMVVWDAKNTKLDIAKLRMGRGSMVQPIIKTGLFMTSIVKEPTPTLQLVGLRLLKLVQFGGDHIDDFDPMDAEGLEIDDDLSAFASSTATHTPEAEETDSPF